MVKFSTLPDGSSRNCGDRILVERNAKRMRHRENPHLKSEMWGTHSCGGRVISGPPAMALLGILVAACLSQGCQRFSAKRMVAIRMAGVAGQGADDCAWTAYDQDRSAQNACALSAFRTNRPFTVRYQIRGKDSVDEVGIARNTHGDVYMLTLESEDAALSRYRQYETEKGPFPLTKCPTPVNLIPSVSKTLSCFK